MDLGLTGSKALVTGASRGIGAAIAMALSREGCDLVLVARDAGMLDRKAAEIRAATGGCVRTIALDLDKPESVEALSPEFMDLDILVNNAGAVPPGRLEDLSLDQIRRGWNMKVFGYMALMKACYPEMCNNNQGVILNIIGMAGDRVNSGVIALSGGNAALIAMTRALGGEAPAHGVRVVGINPSATRTERADSLWREQAKRELGDEGRWPELVSSLPFGRPCEPGEVADVAAFLASPRASYISGSVINVDGGLGSKP